ncbi:MAG TPA: P-loop NTPase [Candidatus Saccharimonadales bacterium]|nr:P-loop NTPase [Candidatus Saccharimonadales bacterium]
MSAEPLGFSIWAVGGGKGGTGKSVISSLLAIWLARFGKRVVLLDADLGGANLHSLLGLKLPAFTLHDFIEKRVATLEEVALDTGVPNLRLISGATDILSVANPKYGQKTRLLNAVHRLSADVVLLDLGAGTHYNTLDFALLADTVLAVMTPQMTSIENAYGFIKGMLYRRLERSYKDGHPLYAALAPVLRPEGGARPEHLSDCLARLHRDGAPEAAELDALVHAFQVHVLVNQAAGERDVMAGDVIRSVAQRYLGANLVALRPVPSDGELRRAIDGMRPLHQLPRGSEALGAAYDLAMRLMGSHEEQALKPAA